MPLWDAVAMGLAGTGTNPEFNGVPLINNSYNCYVGSVLAFYIGEGRVTAIYGGETKLVFDWESVLSKFFNGGKDIPTSLLGRTRRLMGGGDTTLVLGPTNKLNYYGSDLGVNRARDDFKMVWALNVPDTDPEAAQGAMKEAKKGDIPPLIQGILALGFLGILAAALLLRYWWGFYGISSSKPQTDQEQLASVLIPMFEGLWLSLLYLVETIDGGISGQLGIVRSFMRYIGLEAALPPPAQPVPPPPPPPPPQLPAYATEARVVAAEEALNAATQQIAQIIQSAGAQADTLAQLKTDVEDLSKDLDGTVEVCERGFASIQQAMRNIVE
jgi:hypothetical protein